MPIGILFWTLMLLWLILGFWMYWPALSWVGAHTLVFVLLGLLGWRTFGPPLQR
jgi:hypothetical protein